VCLIGSWLTLSSMESMMTSAADSADRSEGTVLVDDRREVTTSADDPLFSRAANRSADGTSFFFGGFTLPLTIIRCCRSMGDKRAARRVATSSSY
jgi:hypothetical protein